MKKEVDKKTPQMNGQKKTNQHAQGSFWEICFSSHLWSDPLSMHSSPSSSHTTTLFCVPVDTREKSSKHQKKKKQGIQMHAHTRTEIHMERSLRERQRREKRRKKYLNKTARRPVIIKLWSGGISFVITQSLCFSDHSHRNKQVHL